MKTKTIKIIYWIVTVLFALFMLFSGISELIGTESGKQLLIALGYPLYLNLILGLAKVLGVIAILWPRFRTLKEWAYAGFTFDLVGASASFAFTSNEIFAVIFPLIVLAVMFVSYFLWKNIKKNK